jgi:hypothetical protein
MVPKRKLVIETRLRIRYGHFWHVGPIQLLQRSESLLPRESCVRALRILCPDRSGGEHAETVVPTRGKVPVFAIPTRPIGRNGNG